MPDSKLISKLEEKAVWVRRETLAIHKIAQETRIASSMSPVEVLVAFYYGDVLNFDPKNIYWEGRDRFIISKGHGTVSLYPILADLGYFEKEELKRVGMAGTFLGGIPDPIIPGYETVNGSLGHGLGVACGIALALKRRGRQEKVFVLQGDGELYEGSVWEAVMFAGQHGLDNLLLVLDNNKICMLDYCKNIINMEPLEDKFKSFGWDTSRVDGHDMARVHESLKGLKKNPSGKPALLVADTIKAKGITCLEGDSLCHIKNVRPEDIDKIAQEMQ